MITFLLSASQDLVSFDWIWLVFLRGSESTSTCACPSTLWSSVFVQFSFHLPLIPSVIFGRQRCSPCGEGQQEDIGSVRKSANAFAGDWRLPLGLHLRMLVCEFQHQWKVLAWSWELRAGQVGWGILKARKQSGFLMHGSLQYLQQSIKLSPSSISGYRQVTPNASCFS